MVTRSGRTQQARQVRQAARKDPPHLTPELIHSTALAMVDADGIEGLSMRKLAAALGVNPMSLYHHVPNKAALLLGISQLAVADLRITPADDDTPWPEQLRQIGHSFRALAHQHSNLIVYLLGHPGFIQREGPLWGALCHTLWRAGLPDAEVGRIGNVLLTFVSGFVLAEINGSLGDLLDSADAAEIDRSFEAGVDILVAGLGARGASPAN
ncbi:TetR/AcrR family transcriptional regulator [Actinopolymorpha rutila]|uniref:AcrR family transcriptional regulator n=1 Tax=Actinopolymorpha rutila TaxID=446787 RepID=A0A852Z6G1_9ACTN|nr:TetR/AcrR family transcriptional regulator [Actinopolymorpha rutila]NYH88491.1 AcrR family transcriptional regulator [Actinopolymorpha rutila]